MAALSATIVLPLKTAHISVIVQFSLTVIVDLYLLVAQPQELYHRDEPRNRAQAASEKKAYRG